MRVGTPGVFWPLLAVVTACGGGNGNGSGGAGAAQVALEPVFFEGSFTLSGTVTFSETLPASTRVQLGLAEATGFTSGALDTANELANQPLRVATSTVGYSISPIGAGSYYVSLSADTSGDGWIGEGDVGGYYAGSAEAPLQLRKDATVIEVSGSMTDLDFGAGPMQCLAHWGDACATDDECRGGACHYQNGLSVTAAPGACSAGACETPTTTCEPVSGSSGTLEETSCFGGP